MSDEMTYRWETWLRAALQNARGTLEAFRGYYIIYDNRLGGIEHGNAEIIRADKTLALISAALHPAPQGAQEKKEEEK